MASLIVDAAFDPERRIAGVGFILQGGPGGHPLLTGTRTAPMPTSLAAEAFALYAGAQAYQNSNYVGQRLDARPLCFRTDSLHLVRMFEGASCRDPHVHEWVDRVREICRTAGLPTPTWMPREQTGHADRLARSALHDARARLARGDYPP